MTLIWNGLPIQSWNKFNWRDYLFIYKCEGTFNWFGIEVDVYQMSWGHLGHEADLKFAVADRFHLVGYVVSIAANADLEAAFARLTRVHTEHVRLQHEAVSYVVHLDTTRVVDFYFQRCALDELLAIVGLDYVGAKLVRRPLHSAFTGADLAYLGHKLLVRGRFYADHQIGQAVKSLQLKGVGHTEQGIVRDHTWHFHIHNIFDKHSFGTTYVKFNELILYKCITMYMEKEYSEMLFLSSKLATYQN